MRLVGAISMVVVLAVPAGAAAVETEQWVVDSAPEMLAGEGWGVAVTSSGRLEVVPGWSGGVAFDEAVAAAVALEAPGRVLVGTSNPARLYRVRGGDSELLADVPGEQVTAVHVAPGGDILVAAAAPGALYRLVRGELEQLATVADGGIWDLATFGGEVIVAAGPPATLYRLTDDGLERWQEIPDVHARTLEVLEDRLLVGTSGEGLVVAVEDDGRMAVLADSAFTEIADLLVGAEGTVWAAALVGEPISRPRAAAAASSASSESSSDNGDGNGGNGEERTTMSVASLDLPKVNGSTASSELLRLTPEGALVSVHRFAKQIASSLARDGDGVLVGTGFEGEIWRFTVDGGARVATVDGIQVVALSRSGEVALTQGPAQLLWRREKAADASTFRGPPRGFERPVRLGAYRVEPGDGVEIRFRSGAGPKPDDTWLRWSSWQSATEGAVPLPPSSAVQWQLRLAPEAFVERVEVSYREVNLAPRFESVEVEPPGVVYLGGPPPSGPVLDLDHPDANGIFSVLTERPDRSNGVKGKKMYRVGFRTVSWKVDDPNGDPLRVDVSVEREDGFELEVMERVEGEQLGVDVSALPDGRYRFHVTASDEATNPGDARRAEAASDWFRVDGTPPEIDAERQGARWRVNVRDPGGVVSQVAMSRDGDEWQLLAPEDGILDESTEEFSFAAEEGRHLVVVRAIDRHHNRTTEGLLEE